MYNQIKSLLGHCGLVGNTPRNTEDVGSIPGTGRYSVIGSNAQWQVKEPQGC